MLILVISLNFSSSLVGEDRSFLPVSHKSDVDFIAYISISYLSALTNFRGRTSITRTRITLIPHSLELNFLSLDQNFTEIYPYNSDSPLTRTVNRFPSEFELPGFYCSYSPRGVPLSWIFFFLGVPTSFEVSAEPEGCYAALSWTTPSYNSCPITRYTVHYRQSNQLIMWQTTFIERNLTKYRLKLDCSSTYKIMVLAWNDRGSSIKDAKVLAVTTEEGIRVVMCFTNRGGLWRFWPLRINRRLSLFLLPALHYALLLGFRSLNFRHYFESLTPALTSKSTSFKAVQWRHYPKPGSDFDWLIVQTFA